MESENAQIIKLGTVYKLYVEGTDRFYIGSTFGTLNKRFFCHKNNVKIQKNKMYEYMNREIAGDYTKLKCDILEQFLCSNKNELHTKEYEYIQREIGKAVIEDANEGSLRCMNIKFRNKPISIGNVKQLENIKEYNRDYYHSTNKYNLLEKIKCECCDKYVSSVNLIKHQKTKKHIKKASLLSSDLIEPIEYDVIENIDDDDDGGDGNIPPPGNSSSSKVLYYEVI